MGYEPNSRWLVSELNWMTGHSVGVEESELTGVRGGKISELLSEKELALDDLVYSQLIQIAKKKKIMDK